MNKLTILMGPPGSGKSTHAKTMEDYGYIRISQDDMGKAHLDIFHGHLSTGADIVIDRMGFDKAQRNRYRLEAVKNGYAISIVEFVTPRQVCYDRCMAREGHPTINDNIIYPVNPDSTSGQYVNLTTNQKSRSAKSALDTYFSRYEEVTEDEGDLIRIQYNAPEKKNAIMVDIDGTIANLDHRLHYVKEGRKDWGQFFRTVGYDTVYEDVAGIVKNESAIGVDIVLCSGRPEDQTRDSTLGWLNKNNIPFNKLIMRPMGNYKRDDITKAMLYRYEIKPYYNIKYVLDDRQQVVDKWRSIGLSCFQVRPGDF